MDKFLETYNVSKLNQEEMESLNRPITNTVILSVIKNSPTQKTSGPDGFIGKFYQTFKRELTIVLLKLLQKTEEEILPRSFYEASITLILKPDKDTLRKQ